MNFTFFSKQFPLFPALLLLIWAAACILVNPIGDFPLNDDFSFGRTVYNLTEQNQLVFDLWLGMTLIAQAAWGGLFCEIFGFSFTALRFSTLVMALIGILSFYQIGKELGLTKALSFFTCLVLAFHPLVFSLSFSFMTDVPFLSVLTVATLFYIKYFKTVQNVGEKKKKNHFFIPSPKAEQLQYFKTKKNKWLALAILFSLLAIFIRQLGMLLPMAFALTWALSKRWNWKNFFIALLPLLISSLSLFFYQKWLAATQSIPETYGTFSKLFNRIGHTDFLSDCVDRIGILLLYMGLFLLPANIIFFEKIPSACGGEKEKISFFLSLSHRLNSYKKIKNRGLWVSIFISCLFGIWCIAGVYDRFPWGNICFNLGLGPKLLKDGYYFINVAPTLPVWSIRFFALLGTVGSLFLINNIVHSIYFIKKQKKYFEIKIFAFSNIVIYGGFLLLNTHFFDRYFISLIPFILILFFFQTKINRSFFKRNKSLFLCSFFSFLIISFFSITATHDYLSWNRARWKALNYLTQEKNISPGQIDGGYEFNGWHRKKTEKNEGTSKSWWWVEKDDYAVTFGDLKGLGFKKEKGFAFETWLPVGVDSVYILKKNR